jgi:hypothetical protein
VDSKSRATASAAETAAEASTPTWPSGKPTPPSGKPTPPSGKPTPPSGKPTPPSGKPTPPTGEPTPPTGKPTPPASGPTPPASGPTPPASGPTAPSSLGKSLGALASAAAAGTAVTGPGQGTGPGQEPPEKKDPAAPDKGPAATAVQTKVDRKPGAKPRGARFKAPPWVGGQVWPVVSMRKLRAKRAAKRGPGAGSDRAPDLAGRTFGRLTVLPAIVLAAWLLTGLPLLLAGKFLPVPMLLISAPLATALGVNVLQRVPSRWPAELPGKPSDRGWMPWFGLLGTVVVAAGFVAWQLWRNSPSLIASRSPGAYFQTGYWIAQHGSLPISASLSAFGGAHAGLHLSSIGFFAAGSSVVPAVSAGLPMLLAGGFWTSGITGGTVIAPVLGGLAVLSFGGLVGRLAGRQWAPAGAIVLAVTTPELYTSRDAFAETAVQVLLFGALCLLADALMSSRVEAREPEPVAKAASAAVQKRPADDSVSKTLAMAEAVFSGGASSGGSSAGPPGESGPEASSAPGNSPKAAADGTSPLEGDIISFGPTNPAGATGHFSAASAARKAGPAPASPDDDVTAPIAAIPGSPGSPAKPSRQPASALLSSAGGRLAHRLQTRLATSGKRLIAWASTLTWQKVATGITTGLTPERMLAWLAGLALGLTSLLSLGSLLYLIPVIAVAGILLAARRAVGVAFCIGIFIGCAYGFAAGYLLARPFSDSLAPVLRVIGYDAAGAAVLTVLVFLVVRRPKVGRFTRKILARRPLRWLPGLASFLVLVALADFAARPLVQTVRGALGHAEADFVATLQRLAHLRVDPTRLYSEDTLYWVIWYAGIATVLLAAFGAAVMIRRCLRSLFTWNDESGARLNWALPIAVIFAGSAAVLWQPFTVPDQPWASRRLVPIVIPGMVLLATWAAAWLTRRARERGAGSVTAGFVGAFCVGAMLLPAVTTSFGFGLTHSGVGGGLHPSSGGLAQHRVGAGQTQAVRGLCSAIGRSSSVVIVDQHLAENFTQVIRGMCGVPVAWMAQGTRPAQLDAVLAAIVRDGRHAVILGARESEVSGFGGSPLEVMNLFTTQESHELTQAAGAPWPARYVIWMATGGPTTQGA